ncbi:hypothetical protein G6F40_017615 [Rhizopus arrhizus]|nr:hypothetical protein G6F32_016242 [Rhizopus arrhizus]KAG1069754.1 hypothetical protein G6F40_017615 [Rhizopus arrhizus]
MGHYSLAASNSGPYSPRYIFLDRSHGPHRNGRRVRPALPALAGPAAGTAAQQPRPGRTAGRAGSLHGEDLSEAGESRHRRVHRRHPRRLPVGACARGHQRAGCGRRR